jgi:hypothetical protein
MKSLFDRNRAFLNKALIGTNTWSNDSGFGDEFENDDAFDYAEGGAMETQSATARPQVSMPYIFQVTNSNPAAAETVVLYGSEKNRTAANFGNSANISILYDFSGFFGGGATGYGALLARTESTPVIFGRLRAECTNQTQLSAPLNASDFDPTGKAVTYPVVNFRKLNQFDQFAIETEIDLTVYGGTELSYTHLAGTLAPLVVRWFFYPADVASLKRGLVGKNVVKEMRRPETYLQETVRLKPAMSQKLGLA